MREILLVLSLPFLLCALAHAASFDCTKAKTAQEKAICGTPALSAADDQMAAAYRAWLAAAPPALHDQHAVAVGIEAIVLLHGMAIGGEGQAGSGEGANQH